MHDLHLGSNVERYIYPFFMYVMESQADLVQDFGFHTFIIKLLILPKSSKNNSTVENIS